MSSLQSNTNGGKLLAKIRQAKGLTQTELAKRASVSRSMVAQLEIGERSPSRKLITGLIKAMDASEEDESQLLLAYEYKPSGQTPEQIAAFLRADKSLSAGDAERIAKIVRAAYEKYASRT